jgi:hypothetical protein
MIRKAALSLMGIALLASGALPAKAAVHLVTCTANGRISYDPPLTKANKAEFELVLVGSQYGFSQAKCAPTSGPLIPTSVGIGVSDYMSCPLGGAGAAVAIRVVFPDGGSAWGIGKVTGTTSLQRVTAQLNLGEEGHSGKLTAAWASTSAGTTALTCPKTGIAGLLTRMVFTYQGT